MSTRKSLEKKAYIFNEEKRKQCIKRRTQKKKKILVFGDTLSKTNAGNLCFYSCFTFFSRFLVAVVCTYDCKTLIFIARAVKPIRRTKTKVRKA